MNYFPILKKTLVDDFSIDGGWKELSSNESKAFEDEYKFVTLKYEDGVSSLQLFQGWLPNYKIVKSPAPLYRKQNILGVIANNNCNYISIPELSIDSNVSNKFLPDPNYVTLCQYYLNQFSVTNYDPTQVNVEKFDHLILDFTLLNEWINSAIKIISQEPNRQTKVNLGKFEYQRQKFEVVLVVSMNKHAVKYINRSWIQINSDKNISTEKAIFISKELRKMFSVILGVPVNTKQVSKRKTNSDSNQTFIEDLYFLDMRSNNEGINMQQAFKQKRDIQLDKLIPNWFNKNRDFELLIQDYLLTISYKQTVENNLINLTEGIEAYYQKCKVIRKSTKNCQKPVKKYMTLLDKMDKMLESIPDKIKDALELKVGNLNEWTCSLKQTRVYIAHGEKRKG